MADTHDRTESTQGVTEIGHIGEGLFAFWARTDALAASMLGRATQRIGSPLQSDSDAATAQATGWLTRLNAIDPESLPRPIELTRRFIQFELSKLVEAAQLHRFDLQVTPYRIGMTLAEVHRFAESFAFPGAAALEQYAGLLQQYRAFLAGTLQNLREQTALGIVTPEAVLPACVRTVKGLSVSFETYLRVAPQRLASLGEDRRGSFLSEVERSIEGIRSQFSELCAYLESDVTRSAPQNVGLWQYPGGSEAYERLIRHHTTLALSADDIHRLGLELVREIEDDMAGVRAQLGFKGSGREFLERIKADPRFYCATPEAIGKLYLKLMRRGETALSTAFGARSFPPYGLKRLPPEAEGGLTFGYYQPPDVSGEQVGYYLYNGSNLEQRPTIGAASLIYHELIPGHHLHLSTEMGDATRPWVRRYPTITAFNEGWAEYAADLGFELGLYEDPYDRYGRHLLQVLMASRLVVDSGLNALGWTFDRARDYLLEHTAQSLTEVDSEVARYATAMPGQALAYALGRNHFWQARLSGEQRLGSRFTLPAFHAAILEGGSLPLMDVRFSIESWADTLLQR